MPEYECYRWDQREMQLHSQAEAAVRAKYPNLIEGSSGWNRAVKQRRAKIRRQLPRKESYNG